MNRNPLEATEEIEEEADYVNAAVRTVDKMAATSDKKSPSIVQRFSPIAACWVILSLIMALRIYFTSIIAKNNSKMTAEIQQLETQKNNLEEIIENIMREGNTHNIDVYCPKKENSDSRDRWCKACHKDWHHFQSSCYAINNVNGPDQRTWEEAQKNCRGRNADLVVIGSPEEQEFIYNRSWSSWGNSGYWIGLRVEAGSWKWVDGSDLTADYWIQQPSDDAHCAISVGEKSPKGWTAVGCDIINRWICEKKALIFVVRSE